MADDDVVTLSMGPLNGLRLRFANTKPGLCGGMAAAEPKAAVDSVGNPWRTRRMLEGKVDEVGVAGRTLTLACGLLGTREVLWPEFETAGEVQLAEDVELALLWLWWWCGIERIEDTLEEVLFLPLSPPEDLR